MGFVDEIQESVIEHGLRALMRFHNELEERMGKGDKRTRRGKIFSASFGKKRRTAKALRAAKRAASKAGKAKKTK